MSKEDNDNISPGDLNIHERLAFLRHKHFGSRGKRRFATAMGIPLSSYATYESGRAAPPEVLVKAAEVTGCDLGWLMTGKPSAASKRVDDPEISDILNRMERLIASEPKAKQAIKAMMDLLSSQPTVGQPEPAKKKPEERKVIPILGRVAAGVPAFWLERAGTPYRLFREMLGDLNDEEFRSRLPVPMLDPVSPEDRTGAVQMFELTEPIYVHGMAIDGFLIAGAIEYRGPLLGVRIDGDSMEPSLHPGDIIVVDTGQRARSGHLALIELVDGLGALCKMYFEEKDHIRISSLNRKYEPVILRRDQLRWALHVCGVVRSNPPKSS